MTTNKLNVLSRFCSWVWNLANERKTKMLAIINDDEHNEFYIKGQCLTRNAPRTFKEYNDQD